MSTDFRPSIRRYTWRISELLRKVTYCKKCDVCGSVSMRFGKRNSSVVYMSNLVFWGLNIEEEDHICSRCKKQVLLLSPNTKEMILVDKRTLKYVKDDEIVSTLYNKAKGTIVVIDTDKRILEGDQFSLTINKVLYQCNISEHNLRQLITRYKITVEEQE